MIRSKGEANASLATRESSRRFLLFSLTLLPCLPRRKGSSSPKSNKNQITSFLSILVIKHLRNQDPHLSNPKRLPPLVRLLGLLLRLIVTLSGIF
ncbi:unnamed protein product [Vicia faba]|uniref:Uncharacterized protein n=1 Tax=Vicia faba TaxID=3906 RepID=A0AAV0Z9Q7_VICFA|nr:unnamed protein product [Vicia faba]